MDAAVITIVKYSEKRKSGTLPGGKCRLKNWGMDGMDRETIYNRIDRDLERLAFEIRLATEQNR